MDATYVTTLPGVRAAADASGGISSNATPGRTAQGNGTVNHGQFGLI